MTSPGQGLVSIGLIVGLSACAITEAATTSQDATLVAPSKSPQRWSLSAPPAHHAAYPDSVAPTAPVNHTEPDREPRMLRATMSIPAIGIRTVPIVPYRGSPDDGAGTRIQDRGVAASPIGAHGGVGPGQVGNYIVTAHRTTPPAIFANLPVLRRGEHVLVASRGQVFDYRVTETRSTSFRSQRSLARQAAAVPGHLGLTATRAMITLSTCATQEDHARGNYWADKFGNPEHRIDKIGVLVHVRTRDGSGGR